VLFLREWWDKIIFAGKVKSLKRAESMATFPRLELERFFSTVAAKNNVSLSNDAKGTLNAATATQFTVTAYRASHRKPDCLSQ
jgi:hypothetical protein